MPAKVNRAYFWLVALVFSALLPIGGCDGDSSDDSLGTACVDSNYVDHGLVVLTGKTVQSKLDSLLPEMWNENAGYYSGPGGVRIDNYLFTFNADQDSILTLTDLNSGVEKNLSWNSAEFRVLIDAQKFKSSYIYTVLRGFVAKNDSEFVQSFRLLVKSHGNLIRYFDLNLEAALEKGAKLTLTEIGQTKFNTPFETIGLARVPSILADPTSKIFCPDDFAVATNLTSSDRHLDSRCLHFTPCQEDENQTQASWMYQSHIMMDGKGKKEKYWVGNLISLGATTGITRDGDYYVAMSAGCTESHQVGNFAAVNMAKLGVGYNNDTKRYALACIWQWDGIGVKVPGGNSINVDGGLAARTARATTWSQQIQNQDMASQRMGFVYIRRKGSNAPKFMPGWYMEEAVYDWSKSTLAKYGLDPQVDSSATQIDQGEGCLVQGMILSVPPNSGYTDILTQDYETREQYGMVTFAKSVATKFQSGERQTVGAGTEVVVGGIVPAFSAAFAASYGYSFTEGTQKETSTQYNSNWNLRDCRGNMIVAFNPATVARCAVYQGRSFDGAIRSNLKYWGNPATDKVFVAASAVMGDESRMTYYYGDTLNPGRHLSGAGELALTKGMAAYAANGTNSGDTYLNFLKSMEYFSKNGYGIGRLAKADDVGSTQGSSVGVLFSDSITKSTETTNSYELSLKIGKENIYSVGVSFSGEVNVSQSSSNAESKGWNVGYKKSLYSTGGYDVHVEPVVYWINVPALKARYGTREPESEPDGTALADGTSLKFIPNHMWYNGMSYWLLAYRPNISLRNE